MEYFTACLIVIGFICTCQGKMLCLNRKNYIVFDLNIDNKRHVWNHAHTDKEPPWNSWKLLRGGGGAGPKSVLLAQNL